MDAPRSGLATLSAWMPFLGGALRQPHEYDVAEKLAAYEAQTLGVFSYGGAVQIVDTYQRLVVSPTNDLPGPLLMFAW